MPVGVESSIFSRVMAAGVGATGRPASSRALAGGGTGCWPCCMRTRPRPGRIGVDEGGGEHVAGHTSHAFEEKDPAHRAAAPAARTARTTWQAAKAAEKPLSMLVTVTPGAQELSIASRALRPPKLAP